MYIIYFLAVVGAVVILFEMVLIFKQFLYKYRTHSVNRIQQNAFAKVFANQGSIFRVIDDYREVLQYFCVTYPSFVKDVERDHWILSKIKTHDALLEEIATLQVQMGLMNENSNLRTRTVRNFPIGKDTVGFVGIEEYIERLKKSENRGGEGGF